MQTRISSTTLLALVSAWQMYPGLGQVTEPPTQNVAPGIFQPSASTPYHVRPQGYYTPTTASSRSGGYRESVPPVVIQFSPAQAEAVAMMEEDLAVMTRIIEKSLDGDLGEDELPVKMGIRMSLTGSGRSVRAMYVEGVGPLFMLKVNFPLLPPPKVEAKKSELATSSEWERARRELKGIAGDEAWSGAAAAGSDYNEEKVETLKKALLAALKQAANIRQVKADEFIAVSVFSSDNAGAWGSGQGGGFGGGGSGGGGLGSGFGGANMRRFGGGAQAGAQTGASSPDIAQSDSTLSLAKKSNPVAPSSENAPPDARQHGAAATATTQTANLNTPALRLQAVIDRPATAPTQMANLNNLPALDSGGRADRAGFGGSGLPKRDTGRGTVLTIRVKKADVDAFAKGNVNFDDFATRATINGYAGSGQGVTSVNSWIAY